MTTTKIATAAAWTEESTGDFDSASVPLTVKVDDGYMTLSFPLSSTSTVYVILEPEQVSQMVACLAARREAA